MTVNLNLTALLQWPEKSPPDADVPPHPAVYHVLDVAAVAERLIAPFSLESPLRQALVLLVALHDLGKISESFRNMLVEGAIQRHPHWKLTEVSLFEAGRILAAHIGGDPIVRQPLYAAVAGHHGQPSALELGGLAHLGRRCTVYRKALATVGSAREDAEATVAAFCALWPGAAFGAGASLTLAHGRAGLSVDFRDLVNAQVTSEDAATCSDWLAESRRRALLADLGVGTIDQALLSVLPVRFQTLRHFGLSSKILIVDEVHELGAPYIGAELEAVLRMHRAAGGSAILLTATLPMAQRARLVSIYDGHAESRAYPSLTVAGGAAVTDLPRETGPRGAVCIWAANPFPSQRQRAPRWSRRTPPKRRYRILPCRPGAGRIATATLPPHTSSFAGPRPVRRCTTCPPTGACSTSRRVKLRCARSRSHLETRCDPVFQPHPPVTPALGAGVVWNLVTRTVWTAPLGASQASLGGVLGRAGPPPRFSLAGGKRWNLSNAIPPTAIRDGSIRAP